MHTYIHTYIPKKSADNMIAPSIGFELFFNAASLSGKLHDLHD